MPQKVGDLIPPQFDPNASRKSKEELAALLRQAADELENHPLGAPFGAEAGAPPPWLKTLLTVLQQVIPVLLQYL